MMGTKIFLHYCLVLYVKSCGKNISMQHFYLPLLFSLTSACVPTIRLIRHSLLVTGINTKAIRSCLLRMTVKYFHMDAVRRLTPGYITHDFFWFKFSLKSVISLLTIESSHSLIINYHSRAAFVFKTWILFVISINSQHWYKAGS